MTRRLATILVALACCRAAHAQELATRAEEYVRRYVDDGRFIGAVLVARDGEPLFRKAYGPANVEWGIANAPDTKFRIGSVTKQFTAVAILQLAESGKLTLDDPVAKHYPEAPATWEKVTVRHLLTHTSGIPSYTDLPDFFAKRSRQPMTPVEVVKLTQDQPLLFEPGAQWKYNNTGYVLLGHLVERVSGMSYADYLRKNLLDRADLKDTGYDVSADVLPKRAAGYRGPATKLQNAPYLDMTLPHAAGSLYSTVDDLDRWARALEGDRLLKAASRKELTTPLKGDYALGVAVKPHAGRPAVSHGGGINGFSSYLLRLPEQKLTVAVLANVEGGAPGKIAHDLASLALGEKVELPENKPTVSVKPEILAEYVGRYPLAPTFALTVTLEKGQLHIQGTGQPALPVYALSETEFTPRVVDARIVFVRENGKVTGLVLKQNGREMPGKREP